MKYEMLNELIIYILLSCLSIDTGHLTLVAVEVPSLTNRAFSIDK